MTRLLEMQKELKNLPFENHSLMLAKRENADVVQCHYVTKWFAI
jgi:hypothetical protein